MPMYIQNFQGTMTSLNGKNKAPEIDHLGTDIYKLSNSEVSTVVTVLETATAKICSVLLF